MSVSRWFSNKNKNWEAEKVLSFATIEDFWAAMNWTQPASKLGVNCDYAVFKVSLTYGGISGDEEFYDFFFPRVRKEPSRTGRTGTTAWEAGGSLRGPRWRTWTASGWRGKNKPRT